MSTEPAPDPELSRELFWGPLPPETVDALAQDLFAKLSQLEGARSELVSL